MIYVSIFFANRLVNIWNSLHSYVVSAETVNCFKTRLDRFWLNQDIVYNFRSENSRNRKPKWNYSKIFIRVGIVVVLLSRAKRLSRDRLRLFSFYVYVYEA